MSKQGERTGGNVQGKKKGEVLLQRGKKSRALKAGRNPAAVEDSAEGRKNLSRARDPKKESSRFSMSKNAAGPTTSTKKKKGGGVIRREGRGGPLLMARGKEVRQPLSWGKRKKEEESFVRKGEHHHRRRIHPDVNNSPEKKMRSKKKKKKRLTLELGRGASIYHSVEGERFFQSGEKRRGECVYQFPSQEAILVFYKE